MKSAAGVGDIKEKPSYFPLFRPSSVPPFLLFNPAFCLALKVNRHSSSTTNDDEIIQATYFAAGPATKVAA
jgi:hypothetical protein